MYAIVNIKGQQYKVEEGQELFVNRLNEDEGANVSFDEVLLVDNDGKVSVGQPTLSGASVSATVLSHLKGDTVIVFHKKRRKGFKKRNGHRQPYSKIKIDGIKA